MRRVSGPLSIEEREQRHRVGMAILARLDELCIGIADAASRAGIDRTTLRNVVGGRRCARADTRRQIERAVGWPPGAIDRIAGSVDQTARELASFPTAAIVAEIARRQAQT